MSSLHKSFLISLCLFLGAVPFYFGACFLAEKTEHLDAETILKAQVVKSLQKIKAPEKYVETVHKKSKKDIPQHLKSTAQKHHISVSEIHQLSPHTIDVTLKGELDTDVFEYLQDLFKHFPNTLSLQEVGLFREDNHVIGKIIFETFFERGDR